MTIPTIHINGTSAERLKNALNDAWYALDCARDPLQETAPNGRDYYPQGPGALAQATAEHIARLAKLDSIQDELVKIMGGIDAQVGECV